jgi:hypothetical protein
MFRNRIQEVIQQKKKKNFVHPKPDPDSPIKPVLGFNVTIYSDLWLLSMLNEAKKIADILFLSNFKLIMTR